MRLKAPHIVPRRRAPTAGLPPGTPVFVGEKRVATPTITVMDYDASAVREATLSAPEACRGYLQRPSVTWFNVIGLHDAALLEQLGEVFSIHPLMLEDILNTGQRPKFEEYGDTVFCVVKMLTLNPETHTLQSEQVSLVLGAHYLLTFQEIEGDVFGLIRDRIRNGKGRIRSLGCDYLAYALLDAIVDHYFLVLEDAGERVEQIQEAVLDHPGPDTLQAIHGVKRDMIFMRKILWPLRELVSELSRTDNPLIGKSLAPYLRDLYEHIFQVIDTLETQRDMLSGALDVYMTAVSNRMNEVMKVLTVIATIFIPLTFIAGIYGMNFAHMPELQWRYGYAATWIVMLLVAGGMVVFFRRRHWL
ncbi:MAG: magnesium/cobalt transporter CorA [Lentisphaerae bacterium]|nr:magnesium/cobalt transporter CorA [Lentisphaerota bacterium]